MFCYTLKDTSVTCKLNLFQKKVLSFQSIKYCNNHVDAFFFLSWVIFNRFMVQVSDKIVTFLKIIRTPAHTLRLLDRVMFIDVFRKPPQETAGET